MNALIALIPYPEINPTAFTIPGLGFDVQWYSLAYIGGLLLGAWLISKLVERKEGPVTVDMAWDLVSWLTFGVLLGGRVGYCLFYQPEYYLDNPGQIIMGIRNGGMSFHGAVIGVITSAIVFAKTRGVEPLRLLDYIGATAPLGIFMGRLTNFINGELWGRTTDVPWAMVFPTGGPLPRHPSQLYEAGLEGLLLAAVMFFLIQRGALRFKGRLGGTFLVGYALSRMLVETVREPDAHLGTIVGSFTMGQLLSAPMLLFGIYIIFRSSYFEYFAPVSDQDTPDEASN